MPPLDLIATKI